MNVIAFVSFIVLLFVGGIVAQNNPYSQISLGTDLLGPFNSFGTYPTTVSQALASGYSNSSGSCNPNLGIAYSRGGKGPSQNYPVVFYFTAGGQISGVSVDLFGATSIATSLTPFWMPVSSQQYRMAVTFRDSNICDPDFTFSETLGNQIVINAFAKTPFPMPLLESEALTARFTAGACINQMGTHYSYDMNTAPYMSWNSSALVPLVLMFNEGVINAMFFTTIDVQQLLTNAHQWDGISLTNALMCLNWCDKDCQWPGSSSWSTMHFFFNEPDSATCSSRC